MGGDPTKHPRWNPVDDQQQRLPRLRHEHCSPVRRQRQSRHQRHDQHVLTDDRARFCVFFKVLSWSGEVRRSDRRAELITATVHSSGSLFIAERFFVFSGVMLNDHFILRAKLRQMLLSCYLLWNYWSLSHLLSC